MNGTDRTNSIINVQIILIIGNFEVLPSANKTPNGEESKTPKKARIQVKAKPPYIEEPGTSIKVSELPPRIKKSIIAIESDQTINKFFEFSLELDMYGETDTNKK